MKKTIGLILVMAMLLALCACSAATKTADPAKESVAVSDDAQTSSDVGKYDAAKLKSVYSDILSKALSDFPDHLEGTCSYLLYDIDKDGVPEILLNTGTCEADRTVKVYTFRDNTAVLCGEEGSGHTSYCGLSGENGIIFFMGQMGVENIWVYKLENGKLSAPDKIVDETEVAEYHEIPYLDAYNLDDPTGLDWTANPTDNNREILNSIG